MSPSSLPRAADRRSGRDLLLPSLTALGVVYGDIGTSPLYALRECFYGAARLTPTAADVLGVLSLIFWALAIVISVKYLLYVMRADNEGEGGILALMSLLGPGRGGRRRALLLALGLFGAALLYGDGMITPAISVLSALEGLGVATPVFTPYVVPLAVAVLMALFSLQHRGTARVGRLFGPLMVIWFVVLAALGVRGIAGAPEVLAAVSPHHAVGFFVRHGGIGFGVLGAVFLVVTGGEALYADMGHFGPRPIRFAWFTLVLPALLLNYFGQGALLLRSPGEATQPFFHLAPGWALYPLVALSTVATVIASQAVITGAFSLTRQAVQLGYCPRLRIEQTSCEEIGQIYLPAVNWLLLAATVALVLGFRSSSRLAGAYGVAVTTTMVITTLLAFAVARERWRWPLPAVVALTAALLAVDVGFFGANLLKIPDGGWFPLLAGAVVFTLLSTWKRGRELLRRRLEGKIEPLDHFLDGLAARPPLRVPGTAVLMTGQREGTPPMLVHLLQHVPALHERVILVTVLTEAVPRVAPARRHEVERHGLGFYRVRLHYGFMESPHVPAALRGLHALGLDVDPGQSTFVIGRETLIASDRRPGMALWRDRLFAVMARNALRATAFYRIPPQRVLEIGLQVEL